MNEIQVIPAAIIQGTGFDYRSLDDPDLAAEAQATARRIRSRLRTSYIDTGNDLLAIKEKLGHGRFGPWLEAECIMSARSAEECMSAARLATKYAITANLPPTILAALASPSADADVVKQVLGDPEAGKPTPPTAKVKEMLAAAKAAQRKAHARQKKSAEQVAKEQKAEKRRRAEMEARDLKWKEDIKAKAERAQEAAKFLVQELGIPGVIKFFSLLGDAEISSVGHAFHDGDWSPCGGPRLLTEAEIETKFGCAP